MSVGFEPEGGSTGAARMRPGRPRCRDGRGSAGHRVVEEAECAWRSR